jgi:hypothetical protein
VKDDTYIGIEEATNLLGRIRQERGLISHGNSWRYWMKHRDITKNTIEITGIKVPFFVIRRKICVNKQEFLNKAIIHSDNEKESIIRRENGPIEGKGIVNGAFVEIIHG